jgi:hypothetical protein
LKNNKKNAKNKKKPKDNSSKNKKSKETSKCSGKGHKLKNYNNKRKKALPYHKLIINPPAINLIKPTKTPKSIKESTYSKAGPYHQTAPSKANKIPPNKTSTRKIISTPVSEHRKAKEIITNCRSIPSSQPMKTASLTVCLPCPLTSTEFKMSLSILYLRKNT